MTREELGAKISNLRKCKGYSIRLLAEKCELSKSTIVNLEQGRYSPKVETLDRIVNELNAEIKIAKK